MKQVAYYKGCLASLSAKELDISTQALAPKVGLELFELERVTTKDFWEIIDRGRNFEFMPPEQRAALGTFFADLAAVQRSPSMPAA